VELAAIGRRVCETEWDLLDLLDKAQPPGDDAGRVAARAGGGQIPGTGRYGRPTAAELVAAVAEFLETDVREATAGQVNFHARVAANALRIVERELQVDATDDLTRALAGVGFDDEAQLAAAIRAGELDGRSEALNAALRSLVNHRLSVAHPGYQDG
jgi:hypothetical protein